MFRYACTRNLKGIQARFRHLDGYLLGISELICVQKRKSLNFDVSF